MSRNTKAGYVTAIILALALGAGCTLKEDAQSACRDNSQSTWPDCRPVIVAPTHPMVPTPTPAGRPGVELIR